MADLGLDFWPPPTSACKKWAAVASLWRTGTTFHSCGCRGPGWRPATRPALLAFLQQQRIAAVAQLEGWRTNDSPERTLAMARFGLQVERIDRELALISRPGRKTKDRASRGGST